MQGTSNHSRLYHLTPAGTRLARYLDYVESRPAVSTHLHFANIPAAAVPEQPDSEIERLERDLDQATQALHDARHRDDDTYQAAYDRVKVIRAQIYALENPEQGHE